MTPKLLSESQALHYKKYLAILLRDLSQVWTPHSGQQKIGQALFKKGIKNIFVRCGRKFGKTEMIIYILIRLALMTPNGQFYYIAPTYKQAKELIWENGRIQYFLKHHFKKYVSKVGESDNRIEFFNGSFIKVDGSDNYEAYRGINPHGIGYDEFKDFHPRFHEGMEPNLATHQAPLIVAGTPPDTEDHFFVRLEEEFIRDPQSAYFKLPTHTNPHISKEWLERQKEKLIARGEYDVWMREYMAEIVKSGSKFIFPMLEVPPKNSKGNYEGLTTRHIRPRSEIMEKIKRYHRDYKLYYGFDPGSSSVFAGLGLAVHKYTKKASFFGNIYHNTPAKTTTKSVYPVARDIMSEWGGGEYNFFKIYDYAARWFQLEVMEEYGVSLHPCDKDLKNKENKLSLIKDLLLEDLFEITDDCYWLIWEMENYKKEDNGKIKKENDHLLDLVRYLLNAAGINTVPKNRKQHPEDKREWTSEDNYEYDNEPIDLDQDITEECFG